MRTIIMAALVGSTLAVPPAFLAPAPAGDATSTRARGTGRAFPQEARQDSVDARVRRFLGASRNSWRDMNVPMADGQRLHDIVVEHGFNRALEIGTSTGHSAIWIAWP